MVNYKNSKLTLILHRYYISYIVQFQFHQSLCQLAGQYAPGVPSSSNTLANCDIYKSAAAGEALGYVLVVVGIIIIKVKPDSLT